MLRNLCEDRSFRCFIICLCWLILGLDRACWVDGLELAWQVKMVSLKPCLRRLDKIKNIYIPQKSYTCGSKGMTKPDWRLGHDYQLSLNLTRLAPPNKSVAYIQTWPWQQHNQGSLILIYWTNNQYLLHSQSMFAVFATSEVPNICIVLYPPEIVLSLTQVKFAWCNFSSAKRCFCIKPWFLGSLMQLLKLQFLP